LKKLKIANENKNEAQFYGRIQERRVEDKTWFDNIISRRLGNGEKVKF